MLWVTRHTVSTHCALIERSLFVPTMSYVHRLVGLLCFSLVCCRVVEAVARTTAHVTSFIPHGGLQFGIRPPLMRSSTFRDTTTGSGDVGCPCANVSHCLPVARRRAHELFAFQVEPSNWRHYNWTHLTTIALFGGDLDNDMLCFAHSQGVRVVWGVGFSASQLNNASAREGWVSQTVAQVVGTLTDGVNVDIENPIAAGSEQEHNLGVLLQDLRTALTTASPLFQLTFDVAWRPGGVDGRNYNYSRIMEVCDFVVIMDYDTRSQVFPPHPCIAGPNAPINTEVTGINEFIALVRGGHGGAARKKLVLGVPWYGYDYTCIGSGVSPTATVCPIASVPFRGVNCSDAAGSQLPLPRLNDLAQSINAMTPVLMNVTGGYATFNYVEHKRDTSEAVVHQVWFDPPAVLREKYAVARAIGILGLSMWAVDFLSNDARHAAETAAMWQAMDVFFD